MKKSLIITGTLLLFLAITGYTTPFFENGMSVNQALNLCNSSLGQFGTAYNEDAKQACLNVNSWVMPISVVGLLGTVLFVIGIAKK